MSTRDDWTDAEDSLAISSIHLVFSVDVGTAIEQLQHQVDVAMNSSDNERFPHSLLHGHGRIARRTQGMPGYTQIVEKLHRLSILKIILRHRQ